MIHRIRVRGYKRLDEIHVELKPLTIILGPNAAGKSNLLDLPGLLARMVNEPTLDAAFEGHRGNPLEVFTFSAGGLEELQRVDQAQFSVTADIMLSPHVVDQVETQIVRAREGLGSRSGGARKRSVTEQRLRYSLTVQIRTASGHLRVLDEKLEALTQDWVPKESRQPFLERMPDRSVIRLRMEKQGHPIGEEIGQDRTIVSKPLYPPHYPHVIALRTELASWRLYFLEPSRMREEVPIKEVQTLAHDGSDIAAFYNTLLTTNERQFGSLRRALKQVVPTIDDVRVVRTEQGFLRLEIKEQGMPLSSRLISEGTLRVLGLLAITNPMEPVSVVGFEEPENGVHPPRLAMVARLLTSAAERGTTQFIINTHSPVLPEHFLIVDNALILRCGKEGRSTTFSSLELGTLFTRGEIDEALDDSPTTLAERIVRGDLAS